MTPLSAQPWAAVVLSGGTGARLGGADKAAIGVDGPRDTLLERALVAVAGADETVVVGPDVPTSRPVRFTTEEPPGSGPAAGLLHGVEQLSSRAPVVVVLAVDMALVTAATIARLRAALEQGTDGPDGAVLDDGRRQPLCAAYRTDALLAVAPPSAERPGLAVRALVSGLQLVAVAAVGGESLDLDEWSDLARIRARSGLESGIARGDDSAS